MSSTVTVICAFVFALSTLFVLVDAEPPPKLKECELANMFFRHGFSQYQTRFSICYAKSKHFVPKAVIPYIHSVNSKAIFFYGMFPITTPFCDDIPGQDSVCGISCKHTEEYNVENEVLCMKHVFEANLSKDVSGYMKREEIKLSDCMRTIFDECRFVGPGGRANNGEPIFLG